MTNEILCIVVSMAAGEPAVGYAVSPPMNCNDAKRDAEIANEKSPNNYRYLIVEGDFSPQGERAK